MNYSRRLTVAVWSTDTESIMTDIELAVAELLYEKNLSILNHVWIVNKSEHLVRVRVSRIFQVLNRTLAGLPNHLVGQL